MSYKTNIEPRMKKDNPISEYQSPVIEIENLKKAFGSNEVLKGFNLTLHQGENVVVLGKSGSGKSILIKCIVGLVKADSGKLKVYDKNIMGMDRSEMDQIRTRIGFLFQSNALYDSMTVRENLLFPLRRLRVKKTEDEIDAMIQEALGSVGLPDTGNLMPSELSGGMRKRIGIARTLILRPDIILYDEPTTGLDPITGKGISNLMMEVHRKYNTSSIIISHDLNCIKRTAHRIVLLIDGINYTEGSYETLRQSKDPQVKEFFEP